MKKFFYSVLMIVSLLAFQTMNAQSLLTASSATNTNAVTTTHTITLAGETNNFECLTFELTGTKVSGTPAGTAVLYGSVTGTNYEAIGADTLTIANQTTNYYVWKLDKTRYKYYKVAVVTTGTQVSTWACYLLGRKQPR